MVKPTSMGMQLGPIVKGKIDDHQSGGGKFLVEPLAGLEIAGGNEQGCELLQTRVVADDEQSVDFGTAFLDHLEDGLRGGLIDAPIELRGRGFSDCRGNKIPGFAGSLRRRYDHMLGDQCMADHEGAELGRILAAAGGKHAVMVVPAGGRAVGFGMSQQQQAAHEPIS